MTIAIGGDDELTADELAYLESGGKATEGLPAPEAPSEPETQNAAPEPPAAQESAPDEEGDDDGDDDAEIVVGPDGKLRAKNGKFVSHKALHKERERRKLATKEAEELRLKLARGEERLAILNEAFNANGDPKSAQQQNIPTTTPNPLNEDPIDPEKDFFGWAKQMQRQKDYLAQQLNHTSSEVQQREQFRAVTETYHNDARRFMAQTPDFQDAYMHLIQGRHRELEFMGMKDERQRNQYIAQEEAQIVMQALQAGQSPAQMMYQLAQTRGFAPGAKPPAQQNGAPPPPKTNAQQKIEQLRNGQQAAQSLSNVAGSAGDSLTMSTLASMSDAEFSAVVDKMSKAQVEKLLGR